MKKSVLVINRNPIEADEIKHNLSCAGTEIICACTMNEALAHFITTDFCLVILDIDMSAEDDHRLLKSMRNAKATPILVLSSHIHHDEKVHAFKAGAHAYMGKPYTQEECLAQAHSLIEMYLNMNPSGKICYTLVFGNDLVIDPSTRQVFIKGKEVKFTRKEFDMLFCLASNPGQVFSREQIYDQVWDEQSAFNVDDVVKAHIKAVRQKLAETGSEYIKNVWGVGYQFHDNASKA